MKSLWIKSKVKVVEETEGKRREERGGAVDRKDKGRKMEGRDVAIVEGEKENKEGTA